MSPFLRQPLAVAAPIKTLDPSPLMFGPNIIGSPGRLVGYSSEEASGCFTRNNNGTAELSPGYGITSADIAFQASLSSPIFGGSTIVQPASQRFLACIKS